VCVCVCPAVFDTVGWWHQTRLLTNKHLGSSPTNMLLCS